ncbi:MAG: FAD-dependent oxidoreductase, partial [Pirellulales bacterium]|nr:FAD-dependent oxidoreductase [Pirellulales bacterium]
MDARLAKHDIVLLGAGHTNAHILRMWKMQPIPDARLTCVTNFPIATYSGMLPGVLAGLYEPQQMQIDLVRLCAAAGVRLICADVTSIDAESRELQFNDRPAMPFDALSIGIGSIPDQRLVETCDDSVLAIKPMQTFCERLDARIKWVAKERADAPVRIAIVGGGAGGVEIAFCLPNRVHHLLGEGRCQLTLVDASNRLVAGMRDKTANMVAAELQTRGVELRLGRRVNRICAGVMTLDDTSQLTTDIVIWATGAVAPPLLESCSLPRDERGFLRTRPTLQSLANDAVFAVGDSGTIDKYPTPKAGVYAVRQGAILWENLRRMCRGESLAEFHPQSGFLKLLNLGNGKAIAEYRGTTWRGGWCWRVKDRIDRRFMAKYQDYQPMEMSGPSHADEPPEMRCAGCGGKVGGDVLSRVLKRLDIDNNEEVVVGLDAPDDVAVIRGDGENDTCVTTDFFAAPLDDAYTTGRL